MKYAYNSKKVNAELGATTGGGGGGGSSQPLVIDTEPTKIGKYNGKNLYSQLFISNVTQERTDIILCRFPRNYNVIHYTNTLINKADNNTVLTNYYASDNDQFHCYINSVNVGDDELALKGWFSSGKTGELHTMLFFTLDDEN